MPRNSFFIDSCIFLGTVIKDENTRACKSFISRIHNEVYIGYISPFVSGEMINSILYADNIRPRIKSEILHAVVDMLISKDDAMGALNKIKPYVSKNSYNNAKANLED